MTDQHVVEAVAREFHEVYERLAPRYQQGIPWEEDHQWATLHRDSRDLMLSVVDEMFSRGVITVPSKRARRTLRLKALARRTDPSTAHAAAAGLGTRELSQRMVEFLRMASRPSGATTVEMAQAYHRGRDSYSPRARALLEAEYVEVRGERDGRNVYHVTVDGTAYLLARGVEE